MMLVVGMATALAGPARASVVGSASIASDLADYAPGSTVVLAGAGWQDSEAVHVVVNDDAGQTWSLSSNPDPTADGHGAFTYSFQLPNYFVANYGVTATGLTSGTATTTFTDAVLANLDQCQNISLSFLADPCGATPANAHPKWDNGNINASNSQYREGDGLPYRTAITGLTNGTWTITLDYDFSKGGVPAVDRLTRFNLTQASNPCLSTIAVMCTVGTPAFSFPMPSEVALPSLTQPALPNGGNVHTFNGLASALLNSIANPADMTVWSDGCTASFVSSGANNTGTQSTSFNDNRVQQNGSALADSDRQFAFKVALTGCPAGQGGNLMLGWTGHVASHLDWGTPPGGAGSISGAPFHMRVLGVDTALGTSGGNQDRSVQLSAIVQTLQVKKVLSPVGSGTFDLQIDGATKAAAVGNGGDTGPVAVSAGNHSVGELGAGGTSLSNFSSSISCANSAGQVVAGGAGSSLGAVSVPIGDSIVCTITNTRLQSQLTLVKTVTNDNGGTAAATAWALSASGPTPISGATGSASVTAATVTPGIYVLSESGPAGYTASDWVCVGGSLSGSNVTLAPGESATCTITNNDIAPGLHLRKVVINNNGGIATVADFTLTANGTGTNDLSGTDPVDSGGTLLADTWALSETGPSGYTASAWVCVGGTQSGSNITVGIGGSATCTITNDDIAPKLHLRKIIVNNNGGTKTEADFTLTANGTGTNDLSGTTPVDSGPGLKADTWALSESNFFGYTASAWVCVGGTQSGSNVTVGIGGEATCTITNDDQPGTIVIIKNAKPAQGSFAFTTTGAGYNGFTLTGATTNGGNVNTQTLNAGNYTVKEATQLGWILTGIGGSDATTPYNCVVTGTGGSSGLGDLTTQTATISLKNGDTVTCTFENTGQGVTRTQGFWATHSPLANSAWFGGTAFGHTFPGVGGTAGIGNTLLCGRPIDTVGKLMGGFWSDIAKKSTGAKRSSLDQARMQLLQQLLAAELNASAFGSVPAGGSGQFAIWEAAYCGTNQSAMQSAMQGAASFNNAGDSASFTPGTSADSKNARTIANKVFWDTLP